MARRIGERRDALLVLLLVLPTVGPFSPRAPQLVRTSTARVPGRLATKANSNDDDGARSNVFAPSVSLSLVGENVAKEFASVGLSNMSHFASDGLTKV
eukprot:CAMPEP_0197402444 /NCGR_PEP_ID=MMETSP1165-20131217/20076_1 /TAXON_ID=284809 /ORGANISM="Chrysocystis fragilis, Strain CCMP3189" /LENGTH=97 /DNA_ID=CAMNT_0042928603 /DNA_START=1 /DNA_END=291 /DNA_ORIENTATION=-